MRKIIFLLYCIIWCQALLADNISGIYSIHTNSHQEPASKVSISVKDSKKIIHPRKNGSFTLKKVNPSSDSILIESPNFNSPIVLPSAFPQGTGIKYTLWIVENYTKDSCIIDITYKPTPLQIETLYGGVIIKKEELETTGEQTVLPAINIKFPQKSFTTFTGSSDPLFYVDGVQTLDIDNFPISEIAYVEYVSANSAASASLGSRGGNGAILITTLSKFQSSHGKQDNVEEVHIRIKANCDSDIPKHHKE